MKKLMYVLFALSATTSLAATSTSATLIKTTTLTDIDASRFVNTFPQDFKGSKQFAYSCEGQAKCTINATITGFSGDMAKQILTGRSRVEFVSDDKQFKLICAQTQIAYCNLEQNAAVLTS